MKKHEVVLIAGTIAVLLIAGGALLLQRHNADDGDEADEISSPVDLAAPDVVVTLEEFGDYQCAPCGQLHPTLKQLKQEFGSNINFVFRNLPLVEQNKNSLLAARAAEAARRQNKFWEMHDLLYEKQSEWKDQPDPKAQFVSFAGDLGLDTTVFAGDLESEQVQFRIQADADEAARRGVDSPPAIFINGRRLRSEATTPEGLRKGIELMLERENEELALPEDEPPQSPS